MLPESFSMRHGRTNSGRKWPMPFVGRQAELDHVRALLADPNVRMVTLLGQGGVGKTRLALELAASVTGFGHGVVILSLAALSGPDEFLPALSNALGLQLLLDSDLRRALLEHLASQNMLLVLDNYQTCSENRMILLLPMQLQKRVN